VIFGSESAIEAQKKMHGVVQYIPDGLSETGGKVALDSPRAVPPPATQSAGIVAHPELRRDVAVTDGAGIFSYDVSGALIEFKFN